MNQKKLAQVGLFIIILLVSCDMASSRNENPKFTIPANPEKGKATLVGRILSSVGGKPMGSIVVRLAEVVRQGEEGAYVLDEAFSPGVRTDADGYFIFENVDVKEYVIIVGDVYDQYRVISGEDKKAKVWNTIDGNVLDVGELRVDLNP